MASSSENIAARSGFLGARIVGDQVQFLLAIAAKL
jgi:hypothetical protein